MLFKRKHVDGIPPTPKVGLSALPPQPRRPKGFKYADSDSEIPYKPALAATVAKSKSITPHPGHTKTRSDSSHGSNVSSRMRTMSIGRRPSDDVPLLKSCLKPSKPLPDDSLKSNIRSRESSQTRGGWPSTHHLSSSPHKSFPIHDYEETTSYPPLTPWVAQQVHHRLSHGVRPGSADPNARGRTPYQKGSTFDYTKNYHKLDSKYEPMKGESISLQWPLADQSQSKRSRHPALYFDVAFDPTARTYLRVYKSPHTEPLSDEGRQLPVSTHCDLKQMTILCHAGGVIKPWYITVRRPDGEALRCIDIFVGIYDTYHRKISRKELSTIDPDYLDRCQRHFQARCRDAPTLDGWEEKEGFRYVDLLRGSQRRIFKGLKQMKGSGLVWEVQFSDFVSQSL